MAATHREALLMIALCEKIGKVTRPENTLFQLGFLVYNAHVPASRCER
jgi:hypothetical protein